VWYYTASHGMFVTGTSTSRAYVAATLECHLRNGIAERISCPTLILEAEEDMLFHGQPQQLYDHLPCPRTLMRFSVAEGAGAHCQVGAHASRSAESITGWMTH
jgi:pimeloyl-ACP methyl ester carboxylesterase